MNWNYLQEWVMAIVFFSPGLIVLALALFALPVAKSSRQGIADTEETASGKALGARRQLLQGRVSRVPSMGRTLEVKVLSEAGRSDRSEPQGERPRGRR
jgi:hypothetical protein